MIKVGGPTLITAVLALAIAACSGTVEVPQAISSPTATVRFAATPLPPPVVAPTAAPDLRNAVSPEAAEQLLLQVPGAGDVLRAVAGGDVDALLGLINWRPMPCDIPHGEGVCPDGIAAGTELPMVNAGSSVTFYVTADTLRPMLSRLLAGEPPALRFASRARQADDGLDEVYYLGLEGGTKGRGMSPFGSEDSILTGVFLTVRTGTERPIAELSFLSETWSAIDLANGRGLTRHEVLTFNP